MARNVGPEALHGSDADDNPPSVHSSSDDEGPSCVAAAAELQLSSAESVPTEDEVEVAMNDIQEVYP